MEALRPAAIGELNKPSIGTRLTSVGAVILTVATAMLVYGLFKADDLG